MNSVMAQKAEPVSPFTEDKIGRDDRSVLVCCHEPSYQEYLATQLRGMGFKVHFAKTHREGIQRLSSRLYDLTLMLENLESCAIENNHLLQFLQVMATDDRRQTFVIMLCGSFATNDAMNAYAQSVNMLINYHDISQFEALVTPAIEEHDEGVRFFKAALKK